MLLSFPQTKQLYKQNTDIFSALGMEPRSRKADTSPRTPQKTNWNAAIFDLTKTIVVKDLPSQSVALFKISPSKTTGKMPLRFWLSGIQNCMMRFCAHCVMSQVARNLSHCMIGPPFPSCSSVQGTKKTLKYPPSPEPQLFTFRDKHGNPAFGEGEHKIKGWTAATDQRHCENFLHRKVLNCNLQV